MKNTKFIALTMASAMTIISLCGCEMPFISGKASEDDVLEAADGFLDAVLKVNGKKALKLVIEDDSESDYFEDESVFQDTTFGEAILAEAEYEADEDSIEFKKNNKKCEVEYTITMPDFGEVQDNYYENLDIDDAIENSDEEELTVTIELELEDDEWRVSNFEDVCNDIYGDMFLQYEGEVIADPGNGVTVPTETRDISKTDYTKEEVRDASWAEGVLVFNDKVMVLPTDFSDFLKDWVITGGDKDENYILNPGDSEYIYMQMLGASYTTVTVKVANWNSDGPIALKDGQVAYISYFNSKDSVKMSAYLPGGVTFGMTPEEVMAIYGEPDYYYESDDSEYISLDYNCYPTITLNVSFSKADGMNNFSYGYYGDNPFAES
ncbi:MAG: hypothetical protein MJ153_06300 [Clostridia bacterium]|nr:hypothetical protein [Clostridia bacterium]